MLGKLKRITATILAIATVVTSIPVINVSAAGNGEKKQPEAGEYAAVE